MRAVLKEALEKERYNVLAVAGLGGAVNRLETVSPDLLLIRPYLESIDGHAAAVYLRRKNPGMRVLILSGTLDDDRLITPELVQSFSIFPKPFKVEELIGEVERVLSASL
jgi:DNA-binding NtrC family response regulator